MACPIDPSELKKLKMFIEQCSVHPQLLNLPQLDFFKTFIEKMGGTIPSGPAADDEKTTPEPAKEEKEAESPRQEKEEDSEPESDVELDLEGCVEPDGDSEQPMGDPSKEPTEEDCDKADELRSQAAKAFNNQNFTDAIKFYTEAIEANPRSAIFHAKRGQVYLSLTKPNACIRDCNRALELNPDSATAYKFRGRAHRLLGKWEEAAKDLRQACKLDFDEQADEWLKEVNPNASKLEQHKLKQERRRKDKEMRKRKERSEQARKAAKENAQEDDSKFDGFPGADDFLSAFKDPEVTAALQDIMTNPANITKYQNNPKVMNLVTKIASQTGFPLGGGAGAGGFPGGFPGAGGPGGFPGFPGGFPTSGGGATGGKSTDDLD